MKAFRVKICPRSARRTWAWKKCLYAELLQGQRRHVGVKPFLVNLGIAAIGDDLLEAGVDLVLQFLVALFHCDAEILAREFGIADHLELFLGVALDVKLDHANVADSSIHTAAVQLFQHQRRIVETMDGGAGLAISSDTTMSPVLELTTP